MRKRMRCVRAMDPADDGDQLVSLVAENRGIVDFEQPGGLSGGAVVLELEGRGFEVGKIYEVAIDVVCASPNVDASGAPWWTDAERPLQRWIRIGTDEPAIVPAGAVVSLCTTVPKATRIEGIWFPPELRTPLSLVSVRIGPREQLAKSDGEGVPVVALRGRMKLDTARAQERVEIIVRNQSRDSARVAAWIVPE